MLQQSQINNWDDLFNRLTIFILECNGEQIRYAAQSFAELCHLFAEQLIKKDTPLVGLSPLLKVNLFSKSSGKISNFNKFDNFDFFFY